MFRRTPGYAIVFALLAPMTIGWRGTQVLPAAGLRYPVNMTLAGERLFVSDPNSGIVIYDVTDPSAPSHVVTIPLTGTRGNAVSGDVVYADQGNRIFAFRVAGADYEQIGDIKISSPPIDEIPLNPAFSDNGFGCACGARNTYAPAAPSAPAAGGGSSYATFAVADDRLYYVDYNGIITLDISIPESMVELSRVDVAWDIETLHPSGDLLFVGSAQGMYIFDRTNPDKPSKLGQIQHVVGCDPVVVSGTTAFVTIRGGNVCGQNDNLLLCIDVSSPSLPKTIGQRAMKSPYGLAAQGDWLYVSTGKNGYELLDVSDVRNPKRMVAWLDRPTRDFIWDGNTLYVLGETELRIFDVTDPRVPVLLGTVS